MNIGEQDEAQWRARLLFLYDVSNQLVSYGFRGRASVAMVFAYSPIIETFFRGWWLAEGKSGSYTVALGVAIVNAAMGVTREHAARPIDLTVP